jgi:hypothetical protein
MVSLHRPSTSCPVIMDLHAVGIAMSNGKREGIVVAWSFAGQKYLLTSSRPTSNEEQQEGNDERVLESGQQRCWAVKVKCARECSNKVLSDEKSRKRRGYALI